MRKIYLLQIISFHKLRNKFNKFKVSYIYLINIYAILKNLNGIFILKSLESKNRGLAL